MLPTRMTSVWQMGYRGIWSRGGLVLLRSPGLSAWVSFYKFYPACLWSLKICCPTVHRPSVLSPWVQLLLFARAQGHQLSQSATLFAIASFPWTLSSSRVRRRVFRSRRVLSHMYCLGYGKEICFEKDFR